MFAHHVRMEIDPQMLTLLRERTGWNKTQLAVEAGISLQYLCDLEAGRRKGTNPAIAKALATALDVPITAITRRDAA
jgi:transcriptional regulator with XRE-family HTH domain